MRECGLTFLVPFGVMGTLFIGCFLYESQQPFNQVLLSCFTDERTEPMEVNLISPNVLEGRKSSITI